MPTGPNSLTFVCTLDRRIGASRREKTPISEPSSAPLRSACGATTESCAYCGSPKRVELKADSGTGASRS